MNGTGASSGEWTRTKRVSKRLWDSLAAGRVECKWKKVEMRPGVLRACL